MRDGDRNQTALVDSLAKADLHLHQERLARISQLSMLRCGDHSMVDWSAWRAEVRELPPGSRRLQALWDVGAGDDPRDDETARLGRFEQALLESASCGAVLTELRVGNELLLWPQLMDAVREAELGVRIRYPDFHAELVGTIKMWAPAAELEAVVRACTALARDGLGGVDLLYLPYAEEADWTAMCRVSERLADVGLGITVHAGEFSPANIVAALGTPGISRIGHAMRPSPRG